MYCGPVVGVAMFEEFWRWKVNDYREIRWEAYICTTDVYFEGCTSIMTLFKVRTMKPDLYQTSKTAYELQYTCKVLKSLIY